MKPHDISSAKSADLRASMTALRRASQLARKTAIQTGTGLIVVRNGRTVRLSADSLRSQIDADSSSAL